MMFFSVESPSGFTCADGTFTIFDDKGFIFYSRTNKQKKTHFNLPRGNYRTECKNILPAKFRVYKLVPLPKFERNLPVPKKVDYVVKETSSKCMVIRAYPVWTIVMSPAMHNGQRISKDLAIAHEFGHCYFGGSDISEFTKYIRSEMNCDHYAINYLLRNGYNPSQLNTAEKLTLSHNEGAIKRKNHIHEILKRVL